MEIIVYKGIEKSDIEAFESAYADPFHDEPWSPELLSAGFAAPQERLVSTPPAVTRAGNELWLDDALCSQTDPEAYFPHIGEPNKLAKLICSRCVVRDECLDAALKRNEQYGIWGGLNTNERNKLKAKNSRD
jgi:WhiB family redox-sensing transcriptional regulator